VIAFLENRRVLYNPCQMEVTDHYVWSVIEIRHCLTEELGKLEAAPNCPRAGGDACSLPDVP
jgi:hypothetical protein